MSAGPDGLEQRHAASRGLGAPSVVGFRIMGRSGRPRRHRKGGRARYNLGDDPRARRLHRTWFRGSACNFTPSFVNMAEDDAIAKYIVHGWTPPEPVIAADASILAIGSCFAQHIVHHLRSSRRAMRVNDGENVNVIAYGAGFVNTFTLRQQFEWSLGTREIENATLYVEDRGKARPGTPEDWPTLKLIPVDAAARQSSRQAILAADAFIITLGLSEIWYDRASGEAFFGAVPTQHYDPEKHAFRVTTVEENRGNIEAIWQLLRANKPDAPIIFTLSPVPLTATFRPVSCVTANSVSKAILRVAVDEALRSLDDPMLFYWPSYEIIRDFIGLQDAYKPDRRHVTDEAVATVMDLFERYFVAPPGCTKAPRSAKISPT